ncbi:secretin N-terminal domain-containing protein [Uliginosibacterium paludis]|uniref:Secretin N-terminal domain-containing protein n=1 Tax=Uliginosibacterium paludis TaxID=1615952 RepID=A0ABV2CKI5_9RHOO
MDKDKPIRLLPIAALMLTLVLQAGCAGSRPRTAEGVAAGKSAEAYATIRKASEDDPANTALRSEAAEAKTLQAQRLRRWAESAIAAGQPEEAMEAYRQLQALTGQYEGPALPPAKPGEVAGKAGGAVTLPVAEAARLDAPKPQPEVPPLERRVTLEFRNASVRSLFDVIGRTSGMNVIFDRDVPAELSTTVYLRNTTVRSAIEKIVLTSGLAWRELDEHTLLVYADDAGKQRDYQSLVVRSFQLANADAKFVANSLKTVLRFKDLVVDEKLNMIVVRDTPSAIAMAEKLVAMHDVPEPEVMLEVAILEVSKGHLQNLGVAWPQSMALTPLARNVSTTSSTTDTTSGYVSSSSTNTLTLRDLYNLTPASLGMSIGSTTLNFGATDNKVNVLANPRIRAKNREKAKILIGERVPNISSTATSNGVTSQNITYVDVGLKLDVEPQIFPGNEIALKIGMEVSSINSTIQNSSSGTVAYRIGTRNASTVLRLKDGENQILAGLIQDSDKKTVTKVPLLGDIPILGHLFRSDSDDKGKTEIVLSITPRLIRGNDMRGSDDTRFDAGTVSSVRGRRDGDSGGGGGITVDTPSQQPVQQSQGAGYQDGRQQQGNPSSRGFGGSVD